MAPIWRKMKAFCCCTTVEGEEESNLIDNEYLNNQSSAQNASNGRHLNGASGSNFGQGSRFADGQNGGQGDAHTRTHSEVEADALAQILDKTQQSIIDVNNLEVSDSDMEVVKRSRLYAEAVKHHDTMISSAIGAPSNSAVSILGTLNGAQRHQMSLLMSSSQAELQESLSESSGDKYSDRDEQLNRDVAERISQVLADEANVECKEELVAYMNTSD